MISWTLSRCRRWHIFILRTWIIKTMSEQNQLIKEGCTDSFLSTIVFDIYILRWISTLLCMAYKTDFIQHRAACFLTTVLKTNIFSKVPCTNGLLRWETADWRSIFFSFHSFLIELVKLDVTETCNMYGVKLNSLLCVYALQFEVLQRKPAAHRRSGLLCWSCTATL
jgi:hypothetical protein